MTAIAAVLHGLEASHDWLEQLYVDFHRNPELSSAETRTAGIIRDHLRDFGYTVHDIGGGVVGVLARGEGATVLMRADIDALPVVEQTGLPYASTVTATDPHGDTVGVMHACGHDVHITSLLGAARFLAEAPEGSWQGTFIALFQPAEETAAGAGAMVDAGLAAKIPRPDVALGQHVMAAPAGKVGTLSGPSMSAADSIKVTLHGTGSHGSMPQFSVDPVLLAANVVQRLQSIVSRELAPDDFGVVTVGALNAGTKSNIIPATATLRINTRAYSDKVRDKLLGSIERIVRAECDAARCPEPPEFEYYDQFPLTDNDEETTARVTSAFRDHFGDERVLQPSRMGGSEDFSRIPDAFGTPYTYWMLGGYPEGADLVPNHSPFFAPLPHPTLSAGVEAIVVAGLAFLSPER